ncbi:hypothetical protein LTR39_006529, partial [Cryomyces antarcticus]
MPMSAFAIDFVRRRHVDTFAASPITSSSCTLADQSFDTTVHDPDYRASLSDFNSFVECLTQKVVEVDNTIPELPVKDIVYRIYRDIRFSPDQTPYK